MGFFSRLLNLFSNSNTTLTSIYPPQAASKIQAGILPIIGTDKLALSGNEKCRYVDVAYILTKKKHYESHHYGTSSRVVKGLSFNSGKSVSVPVERNVYTKGILYFTDKRIIFSATENGFDKKLAQLSSVTPYSNAIDLQFGNKTYSLFIPSASTAKLALDLLLKNRP